MNADRDLDTVLRADADLPLRAPLAEAILAARPQPRRGTRPAAWVAMLAAAAVAAVAGLVALNADRASTVEEELWIAIDGGLEAAPATPQS